jgi:hypothetical protein
MSSVGEQKIHEMLMLGLISAQKGKNQMTEKYWKRQ